MCFFACALFVYVFGLVRVHVCHVSLMKCICNGSEAENNCFSHWMYQIRDKTVFANDS